MAANLFARYIWLIDTLRLHRRLTFKEINSLWINSGLGYGEDNEIPIRTFNNHRKAIEDIFDVNIECDNKDGHKYYIDEPERLEGDSFRSWLIDSYAALNQIQADKKLEGRIIFEHIPSGNVWLTTFIHAMRTRHTVEITHLGFGRNNETTFEIEPYYLKIFKRRWYVIGRNPYYALKNNVSEEKSDNYSNYRIYGLDRISEVSITEKTFDRDKTFSIEKYFDGCCGIIIPRESEKKEHVIIRAYLNAPDYLRSLPIQSSQKELSSDSESTLFSYDVCPTFDFYQMLLAQGEQIEVIEPESVRKEMKHLVEKMFEYYK